MEGSGKDKNVGVMSKTFEYMNKRSTYVEWSAWYMWHGTSQRGAIGTQWKRTE